MCLGSLQYEMTGHHAECAHPDKFMLITNDTLYVYDIKQDCLEAGLRLTAFHAIGGDK
jgi:hypothetical protein